MSTKDEFLYTELDERTVKAAKQSKIRMSKLEKLQAKEYHSCGVKMRFVPNEKAKVTKKKQLFYCKICISRKINEKIKQARSSAAEPVVHRQK